MQGFARTLALAGRHVWSLMIGCFGIFMLFVWAIFPVPRRGELIEVAGPLISYSIERDNSWFSQHLARRRTIYVLFKLGNNQGRFWSDAVGPENVRSYFAHDGAEVSVYRGIHKFYRPINGDGVKTWGLSVDGEEIQSVDEALSVDQIFVFDFTPILGIVILTLAIITWKREDRDAEKRRAE